MKRFQITVKGDNVQRCGFRKLASQMARNLGINGQAFYIGRYLTIEAEGDADALNKFIQWCRKGPDTCLIDDIELNEIPLRGDCNFEVIHGILNEAV